MLISSVHVKIEINTTQEEFDKLVQLQAQKAAHLLQALGERDLQAAQMKSFDATEKVIAPAVKVKIHQKNRADPTDKRWRWAERKSLSGRS